MATKLLKTVKRELMSVSQHGKHRGKPLIIELLAGDMISFRIKGTRQAVEIYAGHCYRLAQIITFDQQYKEKMKVYNERRKAGFRNLRKPKRISMPFDKMYFEALSNK